jgi:hypothetical protein
MRNDSDPAVRSEAETAAVLDDIRIAEAQIARGEGIDHGTAARLLLDRFRNTAAHTDEAEPRSIPVADAQVPGTPHTARPPSPRRWTS